MASKRKVKLPGRYTGEEKWFIVRFNDGELSAPLQDRDIEDLETGATGDEKALKVDDLVQAPWSDGVLYPGKIEYESEKKEDCMKYSKGEKAKTKKKTTAKKREKEQSENNPDQQGGTDKENDQAKKKENAEKKRKEADARHKTSVEAAEELFRNSILTLHVSNSNCNNTKVSTDPPRTYQTPTDPPLMSQASTDPPRMSQASTDPPRMSQASTDPPCMSQTPTDPPCVSQSQTPTDPPCMSQVSTDPPRMSQASTDPPRMSQAPTDLPCMSQTPTDPPRMSQGYSYPPHMSQAPSYLPRMTQAYTYPPFMSQVPNNPPHMSQSSTDQPGMNTPIMSQAYMYTDPHRMSAAFFTSSPRMQARLAPMNNYQPSSFNQMPVNSMMQNFNRMSPILQANPALNQNNDEPSITDMYDDESMTHVSKRTNASDNSSRSFLAAALDENGCGECVLKETQLASLTDRNKQLEGDVSYWKAEAMKAIDELDSMKSQAISNEYNSSISGDVHVPTDQTHYKPSRGICIEKSFYKISESGEGLPQGYIKLVEDGIVYVPSKWLTSTKSAFKNKTKAHCLKLMMNGFFQHEEVSNKTAMNILSTPVGQALKSYAITVLGMTNKDIVTAMNSKISTMVRALKLERVKKTVETAASENQ